MDRRLAIIAAALVLGACAFGAPSSAQACPATHTLAQTSTARVILAQDDTDDVFNNNDDDNSMDDIGENPDDSYSNGPGDNMDDDGE